MSNYIPYKIGQKDFVYDLFSPKDDLGYYSQNPQEYIKVVSAHLAAGKLKAYSPTELIKVEDQFKTAYASLSDEKKSEYLDACSDAVGQLFDIQVKKNEGNNNSLIGQGFLSPRDNLADYLDPLDYIAVVKESIEAGKMDKYSLTELQDVEDKFKEAYAQLSEKKKEIYLDDCVDTIMDMSKLYVKEDKRLDKELQIVVDLSKDLMDNADQGMENILDAYTLESKKNTLPGNRIDTLSLYDAVNGEITVEEQEMSAQELDEIISLEENSADLALNDLLARYNPKDWEGFAPGKYLRTKALYSEGNKKFKAYCVTSLPAKTVPVKVHEQKVVVSNKASENNTVSKQIMPEVKPIYAPQIEYDIDVSEFYEDVPQKRLENIIVAPFPKKKGNKVLSFLAQAAMVVGLAAPFMCNSYTPSKSVEDIAPQDYATAAAEAASPAPGAKASAKSSETKKVEKETPSNSAPKIGVVLPKKKVVKRFPPSYNSHQGNYHTVEKGDTVAGLYEDYAARGGTLSRSDYFKIFKTANPQIESLNMIYVGQVVQEPIN